MSYFVYLVKCSDGSYYCGYTNDVDKRVSEHNNSYKGAKYTRGRRPVNLAYVEEVDTRSAAMKREHAIKRMSHANKAKLGYT